MGLIRWSAFAASVGIALGSLTGCSGGGGSAACDTGVPSSWWQDARTIQPTTAWVLKEVDQGQPTWATAVRETGIGSAVRHLQVNLTSAGITASIAIKAPQGLAEWYFAAPIPPLPAFYTQATNATKQPKTLLGRRPPPLASLNQATLLNDLLQAIRHGRAHLWKVTATQVHWASAHGARVVETALPRHPSQYHFCGQWGSVAPPAVRKGRLVSASASVIRRPNGQWVGFSRAGLVFGQRRGSVRTVTWVRLPQFHALMLPTSFEPSRKIVAPFLLGETPLTLIHRWDYWPFGAPPIDGGTRQGWIATGTTRKGRPVTAWEWAPGDVLREAWVYTGDGISATRALQIVAHLHLTIRTRIPPLLVNPKAPDWYIQVWEPNMGWGDVLVSWKTGKIVGHSPGVKIP